MKSKHDRLYMEMAHVWSKNSYAKRLKVGALLVKDLRIISDGYNGMPSGFPNVCEYVDSNESVPEVLHAEANAITKVAKSSISSEGSTLYVTDSPCIECAKLIIQSGIIRVAYDSEYRDTTGFELLIKAGIEIDNITGPYV